MVSISAAPAHIPAAASWVPPATTRRERSFVTKWGARAVLILRLSLTAQTPPIALDGSEVADHQIDWRILRHPDATKSIYVYFEVVVDKQGKVTSATPLLDAGMLRGRSPLHDQPNLVAAALAEIRLRRYKPFIRKRKAVAAEFEDLVFILPPERIPTVHRPFPEVQDWSSLRVRLKREGCFGDCPIYGLEIRGDGIVRYSEG